MFGKKKVYDDKNSEYSPYNPRPHPKLQEAKERLGVFGSRVGAGAKEAARLSALYGERAARKGGEALKAELRREYQDAVERREVFLRSKQKAKLHAIRTNASRKYGPQKIPKRPREPYRQEIKIIHAREPNPHVERLRLNPPVNPIFGYSPFFGPSPPSNKKQKPRNPLF